MAGVSITTVSPRGELHARRGPGNPSSGVLDAIERTGYTGDAIAPIVGTGRHPIVGRRDLAGRESYFAELIQAIEHETTKSGYTLVLHRHPRRAVRRAVRRPRPDARRRVDGLIPHAVSQGHRDVLPELKQVGIPDRPGWTG